MKGVSIIIGAAIVIAIGVTVAYMVLNLATPGSDRLKEMLLMQEAKNTLISLDNSVKSVSEEGQGSTRNLKITVSGGYYSIDTDEEAVIFSMDSFAQIVGVGISKTEDDINIRGEPGKVHMNITYASYNLTDGLEFGKGTYNLIIRNEGYDVISQKQIVSISV